MTIIAYSRSVLTVLQVRSTSEEELLQFLHSKGETHYSLAGCSRQSGAPIFLKDARTGSHLRVPLSAYFVWDPDQRTMALYSSAEELRALGVDPGRIRSMASTSRESWELLD